MQPTTTLRPSLSALVAAGKTLEQIASTLNVSSAQAEHMLGKAGLLDLVLGQPTTPPADPPTIDPDMTNTSDTAPTSTPATPKRRGRPPKALDGAPKRRGRPPKASAQPDAAPKRRGRPPRTAAPSVSMAHALERLQGADAFAALGRLAAQALRRGITVEALVAEAQQVCAIAARLGLA